jgi:hypothetical protein
MKPSLVVKVSASLGTQFAASVSYRRDRLRLER